MTEEDQMTLMILMIDLEAVQVLDTFVVAVVEAEQELVEPTEQQLSTNTISIKSQKLGWTGRTHGATDATTGADCCQGLG